MTKSVQKGFCIAVLCLSIGCMGCGRDTSQQAEVMPDALRENTEVSINEMEATEIEETKSEIMQSETEEITTNVAETEPIESEKTTETDNAEGMNNMIEVIIGTETFELNLANNETANSFASQLPMTIDMSELHGNEKYYYMNTSLPTNASVPAGIHTGDLMLFGADCLVLFYEDFSTSYRYTSIGKIQDTEGLVEALGAGGVTVTFQ